ncbi:MAG: virulence factor SrfB [Planktomarina sp.]|nr:virulence factor SrfB [Planktomarina sp.]
MPIEIVDWEQSWGPIIELSANTGIQFLDFEFTKDSVRRFEAAFVEDRLDDEKRILKKFNAEDDVLEQGSVQYEFGIRELTNLYSDKWIPIPYFSTDRSHGSSGPFNWMRVRMTQNPSSEADSYLIQLAVDTTVSKDGDGYGYLQPSRQDADVEREFKFASSFEVRSNFIKNGCDDEDAFNFEDSGAWVSDWLKDIHTKFLSESDRNDKQHHESKFEPWSGYLAFLDLLDQAILLPTLKLTPSKYSHSDADKIDVDLILDIGNSRTCGLLVEMPGGPTQVSLDLDSVTQLALRDLHDPIFEYSGLFESRVEFADQNFGKDKFSRLSGRNNAFLWPSFVRFGPEALRLVSKDKGNEEHSGLSSPKRYLWDDNLFSQKWRFHNWENQPRLPRSLAAVLSKLNLQGDTLTQVREELNQNLRDRRNTSLLEQADNAKFSKSSLYGFMISEIIAQAFRQINDPKYRGAKNRSSISRFLRRVIITLPTATPRQEQAIVKSKVRGAIKLLWSRMIDMGQVDGGTAPEVIIEWDEASCTQVMYLYSEIMQKFKGKMSEFLEVYGQKRTRTTENNAEENQTNSIRIACVDIGGGTTDLMVTTYYQDREVSLFPVQNFREGFRRAGDDLLCLVIEQIIIPQIRDSLCVDGNASEADSLIMNLFGPAVANRSTAQKHQQRQFTIKFLAPLALELLNLDYSNEPTQVIKIKELEFAKDVNDVHLYIDKPAGMLAPNWMVGDLELVVTHQNLNSLIDQSFRYIFENISEILSHLDVDYVLMTGRPTKNPSVLELFKSCCAVAPNRVVAMGSYHTGPWYPFKSPKNTIGDPKSSVAVGAMLIALSGSSRVPNFYIPTESFIMDRTDLFVGKQQDGGQIINNDIYFRPGMDSEQHHLEMMTDIFVGSRQLDVERWTATPLYKIFFKDPTKAKLPYKIELETSKVTADGRGGNGEMPTDAIMETIKIIRAEDADGRNQTENVGLSLHTLGQNEEYWLDSGAYNV